MKAAAVIAALYFGTCLSFFAEDASPVTIVTLSGEKFENVRVVRTDFEAITVLHSAGTTRIPFSNLSADLQTRYGYDPGKIAAFKAGQESGEAKARAEADAKQQDLARAEQQRITARRARKLEALRKWASSNLLMASREDQLRAAMGAKYFQQRAGKPLTAAEFQFLDEKTKIAIILYLPEMLPLELLDE